MNLRTLETIQPVTVEEIETWAMSSDTAAERGRSLIERRLATFALKGEVDLTVDDDEIAA